MARLRANRHDLQLVDSHGQIWNELCALAEHGSFVFRSGNEGEQILAEMLHLRQRSGSCPVRRLGVLWRNPSWRSTITRLCRTRIGLDLFNVSTFEWMSGCRIDEVGAVRRNERGD